MLLKPSVTEDHGGFLSRPHCLSHPTGTNMLQNRKRVENHAQRTEVLWLLRYHPQQGPHAGGGSPSTDKTVILLVNWNGANTPTGDCVVHAGFHRALSRGTSMRYSSHNAPRQRHWNQTSTKETVNCGDTDLSGFLLASERWSSINLHDQVATPLLILTASGQRVNTDKLCYHFPSPFLFKRHSL